MPTTKKRTAGRHAAIDRRADTRPATLPTGAVPSAADAILAGLHDAIAIKRAGPDADPAAVGAVVRRYVVPEPSAWTPERVRELRARLGVAQVVFAKLVGVSMILAQGWEQGRRTPAPVAARLLDTVAADPAAWLATIGAELPDYPAGGVTPPPAATPVRRRGRPAMSNGRPPVIVGRPAA